MLSPSNYRRQKAIAADFAYKDEIIDGNFLLIALFGHFTVNFSLYDVSTLLIPFPPHN